MSLLATLFGKKNRPIRKPARRHGFGQSTVQLALEPLEDRRVMSVSLHGGPVLTNVEVESVYYGSAWSQNPALQQQRQELDHYLNVITDSSYLDMLGQYRVARGRFTGDYQTVEDISGNTVSDAQVQQMLDWEIRSTTSGSDLVAPDANRLYIVYTPPNVEVTKSDGTNSLSNFYAYHSSFNDAGLGEIYYAVVAHPTGNAEISGLTAFQQQTEVTSHEMSEAVTDPQIWRDSTTGTYYGTGWHDGTSGNVLGNEIGDLANLKYGNYQGYIVQKEYSNADNAGIMPNSFSLQSGNLYSVNGKTGARTLIDTNVQSYSWDTDGWWQNGVAYLTTGNQVKLYTGSSVVALTGANYTHATALAVYKGSIYMVAANGGGQSYVWVYNSYGTSWSKLTGDNTKATGLVTTDSGLYMLANNNFGIGPQQVWQMTVNGGWNAETQTTDYSVSQIVSAYGQLFMRASYKGGVSQAFQWTGGGWTALTGITNVVELAGANDNLYMLGANSGNNQVWRYNGAPLNWTPLTNGSTNPHSISVDDAGNISWS